MWHDSHLLRIDQVSVPWNWVEKNAPPFIIQSITYSIHYIESYHMSGTIPGIRDTGMKGTVPTLKEFICWRERRCSLIGSLIKPWVVTRGARRRGTWFSLGILRRLPGRQVRCFEVGKTRRKRRVTGRGNRMCKESLTEPGAKPQTPHLPWSLCWHCSSFFVPQGTCAAAQATDPSSRASGPSPG